MICRNCGAPLEAGATRCHACDTKVGEGHNFCPSCGSEMDAAAAFCPSCGTKVESAGSKGKLDSDYVEPERPVRAAAATQPAGTAAERLRGRFGAGGNNGGSSSGSSNSAAGRIRSGDTTGTVGTGATAAERLRGRVSAPSTSSAGANARTYSGTGASQRGGLGGKSKGVVLLLAFFLGGLGIHNFYIGETKKGITRLLLTMFLYGAGSILALIDFVRMVIGNYEYNPDKWF